MEVTVDTWSNMFFAVQMNLLLMSVFHNIYWLCRVSL